MTITVGVLYACFAVITGTVLTTIAGRIQTDSSPAPRTRRTLICVAAALWPLLVLGVAQWAALRIAADWVALAPGFRPREDAPEMRRIDA